MTKKEILKNLSADDELFLSDLFSCAYKTKLKHVGNKVYFRGIIELSNICRKDCFYCGIRKSNENVRRFNMTKDEIINASIFADKSGYGSILLQSGERDDDDFVDFIEEIIFDIKKKTNNRLGITLSLGEQTYDTFARWFTAGAHRYLLRIETSNEKLYSSIHPSDHSYAVRLKCLDILRDIGYQTGTGVMIGLPHQTLEDLTNDILFFKRQDIDMIGMGPYIPHKDTFFANNGNVDTSKNFILTLKMIALTRIYLKDINIAATTALQALGSRGREEGLMAGANVIMPNITPIEYRDAYQLYEGKPCLDENAKACKSCLEMRVREIGEEVGYDKWGDSPHFFKRTNKS